MTRNPLENERAGDQSSAALYEGHGNRTVRVHRGIPWDGATQARNDLLGYAYLDSGNIVRSLPAKDADDTSLYAVRAEIRGRKYVDEFDRGIPSDGLMQTSNEYGTADIHATYESLPYDVGMVEDGEGSQIGMQPSSEVLRFATLAPRMGVDLVTAQPGNFQWKYSGPGLIDITYPIAERLTYADYELILWWWPVAAYPFTAIDNSLGKLNVDDFALPQRPLPFNIAPAQTLQLVGAVPEPCYFPNGTYGVHIHYFLRSRTLKDMTVPVQGWNVFPGPDGNGYQVTRKAAPTLGPFLTADFDALVQPEPGP